MNITPTTILLALDRADMSAANAAFNARNNAGEGFDAEGRSFGQLVYDRDTALTDDAVSIWKDGDDVVLVGDANGLWGVRVKPTGKNLVEYMPIAHRASHEAANNRGSYPANGAVRVLVDIGEEVEDDDGWSFVVREAGSRDLCQFEEATETDHHDGLGQ